MVRLNVSTNQEAFDKVVRHLAGMTHRCVVPSANYYWGDVPKVCTLRDGEGGACALGALIDDDQLPETGDALTLGLNDLLADELLVLGDVYEELLALLQDAHDEAYHWTDGVGFHAWDMLEMTADQFGLDHAALDSVPKRAGHA